MVNVNTRKKINLDDVLNVMLEPLLEPYTFTAEEFTEDNGTITLWSNDLNLWGSGKNKEEAIKDLASEILGYAEDYYKEFDLWARGWRKAHIPYLTKALIINDVEKIGGLIICHPGEI